MNAHLHVFLHLQDSLAVENIRGSAVEDNPDVVVVVEDSGIDVEEDTQAGFGWPAGVYAVDMVVVVLLLVVVAAVEVVAEEESQHSTLPSSSPGLLARCQQAAS